MRHISNDEKPGCSRASQKTNFNSDEISPKPNSCSNPMQAQIRSRPKWLREMYASLALAPDNTNTPIIAEHFNVPTRQEILQKIASAEKALEVRYV